MFVLFFLCFLTGKSSTIRAVALAGHLKLAPLRRWVTLPWETTAPTSAIAATSSGSQVTVQMTLGSLKVVPIRVHETLVEYGRASSY